MKFHEDNTGEGGWYGFDGMVADWTAFPTNDAGLIISEHTAVHVSTGYWVVKDGGKCDDEPVSGPFETKEGALVALRIIAASESDN